MEFQREEEILAPASPGAQYLNSSALSLTVMAVMESQVSIDESLIISNIEHDILPLNTRFSSIMVSRENGLKKWKRVEVKVKDHFIVPNLPFGKSLEFYDDHFTEYLSKVALEQLPENKPLWQVHVFKYPTSNANGTIIFKIHHSFGDGLSLMGIVLSFLQRADSPVLPLMFPSRESNPITRNTKNGFLRNAPTYCKKLVYTLTDFGWGILKSKLLEDDRTPIRSGKDGVELRPTVVTTMVFPLESIKLIKNKLKVTINDVITGIIMMGTRLYMQGESPNSIHANSTALVLLNTRALGGYKSVKEMMKPNDKDNASGNNFAFLHIPIPKLINSETSNSLNFILEAHKIIKQKRNSAAVYLTSKMLDILRRCRGAEATAEYIHGTLRNSSLTISNMIGPINQMALASHPIKGFYFFVSGAPQSLAILLMSYMGHLRVTVAVEKDFIDPNKFKSCIEKAFQMIFKDAMGYNHQ